MPKQTKITLFIPCLVDQVYPEMGVAMVNILRRFGYTLDYRPEQTCCGQPAFNAGYRDEARKVAQNFIAVFSDADVIVAPSGSCTAMVRNYYPELFSGTPQEEQATAVGKKVVEFSEFLARENLIEQLAGSYSGRVSFHNSCHSYRELGIAKNPEHIFKQLTGIEYVPVSGEPVCCGFGGLFSVKFDSISAAMANTRLKTYLDITVKNIFRYAHRYSGCQ
jgi:L-lactate dehydrogenase complex protein LldE